MLKQKEYKAGDKCEITLDENLAQQLNCLSKLEMHEDIQIAGLIFISNEYDKISKLTGNRNIVPKNVEKKKELIEKNGFKTVNPIIVDINGAIIDGQHRKEAAKELNVPFKFMVDVDSENPLQTAIIFNTSTLNWSIKNFIDAYAQSGNENYIKLLKLQEELSLDITKTLLLYFAQDFGAAQSSLLKAGEFTYKEEKEKEAYVIFDEWEKIIDATLIPSFKSIVKSERFLRAYMSIRKHNKFDFNVLLEQFKQIRYTYLDPRNIKESLHDVYNYKRRNKLVYKELRGKKSE